MVTLPSLTDDLLRARARHIRLVLTDCDGTLTDSGVYYSDAGEVLKRFSIRDGKGVELLRRAGIETGIITGESCLSVRRRAEKLGITRVYLGVADKFSRLPGIQEESGLELKEIAYLGDDVNDMEIMKVVREHGLIGAPADAMEDVLALVHFRCGRAGGNGAFRDFADWILRSRMHPEIPPET